MNVTHKVAFAPGLEPVTIWILPPSPMGMFPLEDTTQAVIQALAPEGQLWGDDETLAYAQAVLDAHPTWSAWGFTVVIPEPEA